MLLARNENNESEQADYGSLDHKIQTIELHKQVSLVRLIIISNISMTFQLDETLRSSQSFIGAL